MPNVKISPGNTKMGRIPSVSLPSIVTCKKCPCNTKCYAAKLERLRPSVRKAYADNYALYLNDKETYWRELKAHMMLSKFFRFHVSGDIPDRDYLQRMIALAAEVPTCQVLCFTKRYEFVNEFIESGGNIPENLHIIFSAWAGLEMTNPFSMPEAHVRYRDGTTTANENAQQCAGNCTDCAITDTGCWQLKQGEQVVFNEH